MSPISDSTSHLVVAAARRRRDRAPGEAAGCRQHLRAGQLALRRRHALRRSYAEICENVRDFAVAESEAGVFLGCGALHLYGPHLAEVRSIVVKPEAKGQGAGGKLLRALLEEAENQGVVSVCLFTRIPDFFFHFGFRVADRTTLPDKIYKDCQTCPRLYACDEVAMVRGPLPKIAVLGPTQVPAAGAGEAADGRNSSA